MCDFKPIARSLLQEFNEVADEDLINPINLINPNNLINQLGNLTINGM